MLDYSSTSQERYIIEEEKKVRQWFLIFNTKIKNF